MKSSRRQQLQLRRWGGTPTRRSTAANGLDVWKTPPVKDSADGEDGIHLDRAIPDSTTIPPNANSSSERGSDRLGDHNSVRRAVADQQDLVHIDVATTAELTAIRDLLGMSLSTVLRGRSMYATYPPNKRKYFNGALLSQTII